LQDPPITDLLRDQVDQPRLRDGVEKRPEIGIDAPAISCIQVLPHATHRIMRRAPFAIPEGAVLKERLEDRFHPLDQGLLAHAIENRRNAELSDPAIGFVYLDSLHRLWLVGPIPELAVQSFQIQRLVCLKLRDGHRVDSGTTVVLLHLLPGQYQVGTTVHLVNQRMDFLLPSSGLR
jgi:ABC-type transporter Mla MlaB component